MSWVISVGIIIFTMLLLYVLGVRVRMDSILHERMRRECGNQIDVDPTFRQEHLDDTALTDEEVREALLSPFLLVAAIAAVGGELCLMMWRRRRDK